MKKVLCMMLAISVLMSTLSVCFVSFAEQSYAITNDSYCYATNIGGSTVTQASAGQTIFPVISYEKIDASKSYVKGFTLTTAAGSTFLGTDESFQMPAESVNIAAVIAEKTPAIISLIGTAPVNISEKCATALMESDWILLGAISQGVVLDFNADSKADAVVQTDSSGYTIALTADCTAPAGGYTQDVSHLGYFFPYTSVTVKIEDINKVTSLKTDKIIYKVTCGKDLIVAVVVKNIEGRVLANKYVRIDLFGKYRTLKTNAKGIARFTVGSKVKAKTYTGKVTCEGVSSTFKVQVMKIKTKIKANPKTFKVKVKTKKYTVVLNDANNKPIKKAVLTLKVNGKTYKAKTNTKGKAVFKITKLKKKGKYTAVVKFAGTDYYNKASKKVRIKVK